MAGYRYSGSSPEQPKDTRTRKEKQRGYDLAYYYRNREKINARRREQAAAAKKMVSENR